VIMCEWRWCSQHKDQPEGPTCRGHKQGAKCR
jgi:hypothetical protein